MSLERLTPIVDANGDPFYVVERDFIGAEHINAQAAWTRKHHAVATLEHDEEGVHDQWGIPRAFIYLGVFNTTRSVEDQSRAFGVTYADDPTIITATPLGVAGSGQTRITLSKPLPNMDYSIIGYSGMSRASRVSSGSVRELSSRWRVVLDSRISQTQFDISIDDDVTAVGFIRSAYVAFAVRA